MTKKKRVYLHGECIIAEISELPQNLKKRKDKESIMVAESETIGNEHRIKIKDGVEFYEDEKGILYIKNTVPTEVYCLHANRHDTITLPESIWKIDKAVEYDYFTQQTIHVAD